MAYGVLGANPCEQLRQKTAGNIRVICNMPNQMLPSSKNVFSMAKFKVGYPHTCIRLSESSPPCINDGIAASPSACHGPTVLSCLGSARGFLDNSLLVDSQQRYSG